MKPVEEKKGEDGSGISSHEQQQLPVPVTPPPTVFVVPPGLSPSALLDSPAFFSSEEALAQEVTTAQAVQFHSNVQPHDYSSSLWTTTPASLTQPPVQEMLPVTSDSDNTAFESAEVSHSENKSQSTTLVDKPHDDDYNWHKYGQKQVKGFPTSYYKCSHPSCPVKKKVESSLEGQVTKIIYRGLHNHQPRPPNKRARSKDVHVSAASKRGRESSHGAPEHISGSSDGEELVAAEVRTDEADATESDMKRMNVERKALESASSRRTMRESRRITIQTISEVDLLDDGYRWRKYGQKVVQGNPNPRSYYKCTYPGCHIRKHVERASTNPKAVLTTYDGRHNHDVPAARNSSHNTANAAASANIMHPKAQSQAYLNRRDF